jgi:uncharacterized repeat protein (TIGR03803 family)
MEQRKHVVRREWYFAVAVLALPIAARAGDVPRTPDSFVKTLYSFKGPPDGANPAADLIADAAGNLYGTTEAGGTRVAPGKGTVFKLTPSGTETVLYRFQGGSDGEHPAAGLIADAAGNLYGTTRFGGTGSGVGFGTVFNLSPDGTETVLYRFHRYKDGPSPSDLIADAAGNLYGTTQYGGSFKYCGTVFKLSPSGTETTLHRFANGYNGCLPNAGLIADMQGRLYGTTFGQGGASPYGAVFRLTP